jgi:N-acetylglucosamine-6-phosphate deacetylase
MKLGVREALVSGAIISGDVEIEDGAVAAVGLHPPGVKGLAVPGFVDLQINGFSGVDFAEALPEDYRVAAVRLAGTGVTAFQPTLIALPEDVCRLALARLAEAIPTNRGARIIGMHIEGPFLSPARHGAHDPAHLRKPDVGFVDRLLAAGPVSYVTIAPELPGAIEVIDHLVERKVTVAVGHSNADAAEAHLAFDHGARSVTHLFNAQRPFTHRDPGLAGAALSRPDVFVTVIIDGVHLAPETAIVAGRAAGRRLVLITDATAATGMPDGRYRLGLREVIVADGRSRLDDGTLAGSVLTMDRAVRNLISYGFDPPAAIAAATSAPAELIGRPELGTLQSGAPADVCVLDDRFEVVRTMVRGEETFAA